MSSDRFPGRGAGRVAPAAAAKAGRARAMGRAALALAVILGLAACAPRGELRVDPAAAAVGAVAPVFVGTTRGAMPDSGEVYGRARSLTTRFARLDVAVPPDRSPGEIRWTPPRRKPDPRKEFVTARAVGYPSATAFRADLAAELARRPRQYREAIVFVHGFNTSFAEGVYRMAQIGHDLDLKGILVHYAWPSHAHALAYVYDRDSALFARDGLETLLQQVEDAGAQRIIIVAHSMGAALAMETLRQVAIGADRRLLSRIEAVVLVSPDIDVDVFRAQATRLGRLANPIIIFTSRRDLPLALSARITGRSERLGNLRNLRELGDLDVVLFDTTAFNTGDGHFNVAESSALLAIFSRIRDIDTVLSADQAARTGLLPGAVLTVQGVTQIVLSPVTAISGLRN